jgi:hypothetical protein
MKKFAIYSILLSAFLSAAPAAVQAGEWTRIESFMREFSYLVPDNYSAFRSKEGKSYLVSSYRDGVSINIFMQPELSPRRRLVDLEEKYDLFDCAYEYYTLANAAGKIFTCESDKQFFRTIYLALDTKYYRITVGADSSLNNNAKKFLNSIRIMGKPMFPKNNDAKDNDEKTLAEEKLTTDKLAEQYLKMPDSSGLKTSWAETEKAPLINADSPVYSRELYVLKSAAPKLPVETLRAGPRSARARLKITFLATGEIGKAVVAHSTNGTYTQAVLDALPKMRFIPAQIAGKDVAVTRVLEFGFDT